MIRLRQIALIAPDIDPVVEELRNALGLEVCFPPAELRTYLREHMAHYKVPRHIDFRAELPRHPTGKLYKRLLRDEYTATDG